LQWLGVFDPSLNTTPSGSVIKTFCALLEAKLKCVLLFAARRPVTNCNTLCMYAPGERDLLAMYHEVEAQFPHGKEVCVYRAAKRPHATPPTLHSSHTPLLPHSAATPRPCWLTASPTATPLWP
jgi:hypothetical protein